jgi:hypothetical protein
VAKQFTEKCPIWGTPSCSDRDYTNRSTYVDSPRAGGCFSVKDDVRFQLRSLLNEAVKLNISRWIAHNIIADDYVEITASTLATIVKSKNRSVPERFDDAVVWFAKHQKSLSSEIEFLNENQGVQLTEPRSFSFSNFLAASSSSSVEDGGKLLDFLVQRHLLIHRNNSHYWQLTPSGWERFEELNKTFESSSSVFVAMWFSTSMDSVFADGFAKAIEDAGYVPVRIDRKEHNNKIDDEIVAEIRRSKFVVADFTSEIVKREAEDGKQFNDTHARGGVYFEAGFAKGLGKEVIWTVREDVLPFVHFDTSQFAHIVWKDADDLRLQLSRRISATLGDGPNKKPA